MEDKLSIIYKYLSSQNIANLPSTEEDFGVMMQDDEKAGKIHNYLLSQKIANVDPDFNAFSEYVGRKKKDETAEPLSPVSSPPAEDASPAQQKSALQSKYSNDVENINALDYDSSLPQGYTLKDLSGAKTRQAALYEKSIVDLQNELEIRAKELQSKAETQEELDKEIKKLSDEMTKRAEALPDELEKPKYIAPEDIKVIESEVANIMQSGEAFDTKNKHLEELIKYFENMAPEDMRPKIRGELNQIIAKRAMTQGGQITSFAAKTEGKRMKAEIEEKDAPIVKEWAVLSAKKNKTTEETARMDDLYRQSQMYSQANRLLDKLDRLPDDQGSFVQGLSAPWDDGTIASLGISDVIDAAQQLKASSRVGNMRDTEADRAVLNVLGLYQVGQSGLGSWYDHGKGLAETVPFMAQFALTGGLPGIGTATAKKMAAEQIKRTLVQKAGKFAAKTAAQAAIRTPLLTTGYQRALEGMRGTTVFDEKTGSFVIDQSTRESVIEGIAKGAFTNFTEAFFESGGEAVGKGLNILASKFGVKLPKAAPWARAVQDRVAFNGFLGEFVEELPTGFIQGIVTEGQSVSDAWKQLKSDTPDILFTTAVISGVFGGMSAPGSIANARRESRIAATIGEDALTGIDEAVKIGGRENVIKALDKVWAALPEESKTPEVLKDLIKYTGVSISEQTATDFQGTIANTAQVEAPVVETETAPVEDTKTAPAVEETSGGTKTIASENIPETEILDNGDVMYHKKGEIVTPDPEIKPQVRAELERLNSLSEGQKVVLVEGMAFPEGTDPRAPKAFAKNADMLGLHLPGEAQSYINVDNITSVEEARAVWLHESGVHGGVERLFDTREAYDATMKGVIDSVGEEVALKTIDEQGGSRQFYEDKRETLSKQKFKALIGEEYLAFISNKIISDPNLQADKVLSAEELTIWQKFVKAINNAIAKVMGTPMILSDADIANLIIDATNVAMSKRGAEASFRGKKTDEVAAAVKKRVSDKQRDEVAVTPEKSGKFAGLTQDNDGNLVFFHRSSKKREVIDPAMYGTNPANLTSKDELRDLSMVGGSFFYTTPDYSEGGTGDVVHVIKAKPNEVYDLQEDPLNFYDEAKRRFHAARGKEMAFGPNAQMAWISQVAQDNGFKIGIAEWGRNGQLRAQIARSLTPDETYTKEERVSGGAKTTQWKGYHSNKEQGWKKKNKSESTHSRRTDEWIVKEESRLGNTMMTRDEIQAMLETGEYAILTGENPNNTLQNDGENRKLNKAAEKWLSENGFTPIPVVGKYDGKGELSYIVPGMTIADARRAQTALGQEMIAHSSGMLKPGGKAMHPRVANKVNYPTETSLKDADFASLVKDSEGKPLLFSIEYDWNADQVVKVGTVQESIIAVSKSLGQTFPDVKIIVGKDIIQVRNQLYKALKSIGVSEKNAQEIVNGFTWNTAGQSVFIKGKPVAVVINESMANERTAGHEMWEVILRDAFQNNQGKLQEFVDAIDKQLRKSGYTEIADKLKMFTALYGEDGQFSEYMAELGGYLTAGGLDLANLSPKDKTLLDRIKEIINQFAKALTGSEVFLKEATPENILDFMTTISQKIAAGESVAENLVEGEAPADAEGLAAVRQSISIMAGIEAMKKWGLSTERATVRLIGEALQTRQRKRYGTISKNDRSPAALKKISKWMADEAAYFYNLKGAKSGVGWYGKLWQEAVTQMGEVFPELKTDQNARDMFTMLMAITSDGQKVLKNFQLAAQAYNAYRSSKNGRVPTKLPMLRAASIRANLKNINDLLVKHNGDIAKIKAELLVVDSIKKINAARRKAGLVPLKSDWPASFEAPLAASVFGPKLGMFFANLSGLENYPTLDRWWSRMFNRYRGTLVPVINRGFDKGVAIGIDNFKKMRGRPSMTDEDALLQVKDYVASYAKKGFKHGTPIEKAANTIYKAAYIELNDRPFNTSDRAFMYDCIVATQKILKRRGLDFTIADIQAVLWYYEKALYKQLGARAIDGASYAEAAEATVELYKASGNSLEYDIKADASTVESEDDELNEADIEVRSQMADRATPISSQLRGIIQKRIDKAYAIGLGDERKTHVGEKKLFQKRIDKAHDIGLGEGNIAGELAGKEIQKKEDARDEKSRNVEIRKMFREMSKFISATLKQNPFATELSNAQVRTLVNAARRVNEKNVDEFMDLVSRLVDNREYAKAIDDARQNQRAIRKRVNDGRYYGQDTPKVADFISIPIRAKDFSIEDLSKYNDVATLLLAGRVPTDGIVALRSYVPPIVVEVKETGMVKAINAAGSEEAVGKIIDEVAAMEIETLADFRRVLRLTELLSDRISNLKFEEDVIAEMESRLNEISMAMETRAEGLLEEAAEERAAAIAEAQDLIPSIKRELFDEEVTDEEWSEVSDFKNITEKQMESMTLKQILLYNNIMYGLTEGFVNKELYSFLQEIDTRAKQRAFDVIRTHLENGYAKIRALGDRLYKHNLTKPIAKWIDQLRKDVTGIITMFDLNKLNLIDQKLLGIYDKNVHPIYESFVAPLASAASKMENAIAAVSNKYWTAANEVSEDTRNLLSVLMREMDFRSVSVVLPDGIEYTWDTLPAEYRKDISRWEIEERAGLSKQDTTEMEKLYRRLPMGEGGNIDIDASLAMLFKNKGVEAFYNVIREILVSHVGKVRVTTAMRGGVYEGEGPFYFPRFNRDFQNPSKGESYEIQNIREIYSPFKAIRKRAKATYSRVHTRNVNEYRMDNVMGVFIADVNRDYYLSRVMTSINTSLQRVIDVNGGKNKDVEKVARAIQYGIINRITTEMGEKASAAWLSKLVAWQRTFSLAQPERILKELPTNTVRYWLRNPSMKLGLGHDKRWRSVVRMQGSPIALKKITKFEEANVPTEDAKITTAERGAILLYTISDTIIGRSVYGNEFSAAFKLKTGEAFDIDRYLSDEKYRIDNKEALAHADAMAMIEIETLFNSQSWVSAPSKHKYIPFVSGSEKFSLFGMKFNPTVSRKSSAAKVLGYMQSFNFGESSEAMNAILTLARPGVGPSSKVRAARLLGNLAATNYMYMSLTGFFYTVLKALFDDDEDVSEAISAYFSLENQRNLFIGSVATLGMSRYGNVMRTFLTVVLGTSDYFDPKQETVVGKVTKYTLDAADQTIMVRPLNPGKRTSPLTILDNVGLVYGAVVADIWRAGLSIGDISKKVMDEGFDSLSLEEKEVWLAMSALNQGIGLMYPNFISPIADKALRLQARGMGPSYTVTPSKGVGVINGIDVLKVYDIEGLRGITDNKVTVYSSGNYETGNGALELSPKEMSEYQSAAKVKFERSFADYVIENEIDIAIDSENKNLTYERKEAVTAEINKLWSEAKAETRKEMFQYKNFQDDPTYERLKKYGAIPNPITSISRTIEKVEVDILKGYPEYAVEVNKLFMKGYLEAFEREFPSDSAIRASKNSDEFEKTVKRISTDEAGKARDAVFSKYLKEN